MKKVFSILVLFSIFVYIGGVFNSDGVFRGTKATLTKTLDAVMWFPDKVEYFLSRKYNLDFVTKPPEPLTDEELAKINPDFNLPYIVGDRTYILYLKFVSYEDGSTGFFDGLVDLLLFNSYSPHRGFFDIFTFTIVGNSYNNQWIGSQIEIRAGAHSALPRYHKIKVKSLVFPDGNTYQINDEVELPYEKLFLPLSD